MSILVCLIVKHPVCLPSLWLCNLILFVLRFHRDHSILFHGTVIHRYKSAARACCVQLDTFIVVRPYQNSFNCFTKFWCFKFKQIRYIDLIIFRKNQIKVRVIFFVLTAWWHAYAIRISIPTVKKLSNE